MLLASLKQETIQLHQQIENGLDLFRSDFTLEDYRSLLVRFYGYYSPWEERAAVTAPCLLAQRSKRANLAIDLEYLGMPRDEISSIAPCDDLPPLDTPARVLGSMYVVEGSTLGGQILLRHMRSRFGLKQAGCAFFSGYGEQTGRMWKQFGGILEESPSEWRPEIVSSAVATFESMGRWLGVPQT
jgi:heme oxygenase (biliverdin-IX-beta and delta-forming)